MSQRILVIEDNAEMADNIASILQLARYEVIVAPNGKVGVEMVQQRRPDLILCDVMMPELDGHGVLFILRNDPDTLDIPFIFLTAKADKSDFRTGMNLGADDYITKPFDGVDLLKVIEMRLKRRESLRGIPNSVQDVNAFFSKTRELQDFNRLSANRVSRSIKKNEVVFGEGRTAVDLYFIEQGQIKTSKVNADGKELITGVYRQGSFLGYVELLQGTPYNETAMALEDSQLTVIPKADFLTLIYTSRDVARKFINMLSNNINQMENRLLDIAYQSVRQRVAGILLELLDGQSLNSLISFTRRDMSSMVGTAPESFNRTLADLKEEGLIEIFHEGIRIIDKSKLEKLLR